MAQGSAYRSFGWNVAQDRAILLVGRNFPYFEFDPLCDRSFADDLQRCPSQGILHSVTLCNSFADNTGCNGYKSQYVRLSDFVQTGGFKYLKFFCRKERETRSETLSVPSEIIGLR